LKGGERPKEKIKKEHDDGKQLFINPGMLKRKGVQFPCCRATVMETNAEYATVRKSPDGKAGK